MLTHRYLLHTVLSIACLCISKSALYSAEPDSVWQARFNVFYYADHKGSTDTLIANSWKAFDIARRHHSYRYQILALGKLINTTEVDSFQHYLAILDTFPKSVLKVQTYNSLQSAYYRFLLADISQESENAFFERIIQQADSVYADSLHFAHGTEEEDMYLFYNINYLTTLANYAYIDSKSSPFYGYLLRLNRLVDRLHDDYRISKLNTYITTSSVYLGMKDYERAIEVSEQVIQGVLQSPRYPNTLAEQKMSEASVLYYMCYQQLQAYDHISDSLLQRNWAFIHSPYGGRCRDYLNTFGNQELTPSLYYHMAIKRYDKVIDKAEKKIQEYKDEVYIRHHFVDIQNKAIKRSAHPEHHLSRMNRNFRFIQEYHAENQQEKEVDYASLSKIVQLQHRLLTRQLEQEDTNMRWIRLQLLGTLMILVFGLWAIRRIYLSNKKKKRMITRLRVVSQETEVEKEKTEQAKKLQTVCLDNMNHEIRSPLNSIVGFSELLLDNPDLDNATKREFTEQIDTSSTMLLQIINDVLDTAQLESGQYTLQNDHWPLLTVCKHATKSMQHRLQPGVRLELDFQLPSDTTLYVDKTRLLQILLNLLSNACKHTTEGHITLLCGWSSPSHEHILFTVTDTGRGVPKDKQSHLFERFAKLNHKAHGTGLGLHICATLAHVMKAQIGYDESYTDGARFYFVYPYTSNGQP